MRYFINLVLVSLVIFSGQSMAQIETPDGCPDSPPEICWVDGLPLCGCEDGCLEISAGAWDDCGIRRMVITVDNIVVAKSNCGEISYSLDLDSLSCEEHTIMVIAEDCCGSVDLRCYKICPCECGGWSSSCVEKTSGFGCVTEPYDCSGGDCNVKGWVWKDTSDPWREYNSGEGLWNYGVEIALSGSPITAGFATTDKNGQFEITVTETGLYDVTVTDRSGSFAGSFEVYYLGPASEDTYLQVY